MVFQLGFVLMYLDEYYTNKGSHVLACFVDFRRTFDSVNYWKLFSKLLYDGTNTLNVRLLAVWDSNHNQRWRSSVSAAFNLGNGTRRGGVLSPYLFTRYIRDMLSSIVNSDIWCSIGNKFINVLAYADDLVLIAPSWRTLQLLLNTLNVQSDMSDMQCNADQTACMVFPPSSRRCVVSDNFPPLTTADK